MIILDRLLIGGIKFVLNKIARAVDDEMNDETVLREELLAAQMRVELGEMSDADFQELEAAILGRMREIRANRGDEGVGFGSLGGEVKVTGVEATFGGDNEEDEARADDARDR